MYNFYTTFRKAFQLFQIIKKTLENKKNLQKNVKFFLKKFGNYFLKMPKPYPSTIKDIKTELQRLGVDESEYKHLKLKDRIVNFYKNKLEEIEKSNSNKEKLETKQVKKKIEKQPTKSKKVRGSPSPRRRVNSEDKNLEKNVKSNKNAKISDDETDICATPKIKRPVIGKFAKYIRTIYTKYDPKDWVFGNIFNFNDRGDSFESLFVGIDNIPIMNPSETEHLVIPPEITKYIDDVKEYYKYIIKKEDVEGIEYPHNHKYVVKIFCKPLPEYCTFYEDIVGEEEMVVFEKKAYRFLDFGKDWNNILNKIEEERGN